MKHPNFPGAALLLLVVALWFFLFGPASAATAPVLPPMIPPPSVSGPALPLIGLPPPQLDASFPQGIRLTEFARVVLQDVLKQPFILSTDFLASQAMVGFSAKELKVKGSEQLLRDVLAEQGFSLRMSAGYYRINKIQEGDKPDLSEDFYYKPRHRDLGYLSRLLQPLFPTGGFTNQGKSGNAPPANAQQQGPMQTGGAAAGGQPVDDGRSLYSQTSDNADAFIYHGQPKDVQRLKAILAQIDTPVPRVLVRAMILEVQSRQADGYSISAVASMLSNRLGISITKDAYSNSLTFKAGSFNAVASALSGDGSVKVLTAPSVYAETGAAASLSVGSSVPTLGAIQYNGNGQSSQSVQYQDTGVIFTVTPRVLDDAISLNVTQEISDAVATTSGVQGSPTLIKRKLQTVLNMQSGDWVILGGLSSDKSTTAADSLPFWRSLKLSKSSGQDKTDVVILLYVEKS